MTCRIAEVLLKGLYNYKPAINSLHIRMQKENVLCHKNLYPLFDEAIVSWACDFSNQEILSKMMLDAYSQIFITHPGFAVMN